MKIYEQGKKYYDALKSVNNLVKDARKVQQTILMVGDITDTYVTSFQRMMRDDCLLYTSTRTTAAIPTQEAATSEKGIELSEEEATFDDGNTETVSRPTQVPEDKLDETFTSIPPSELDRKSTRLNSSHSRASRMPSSA